MMRWTWTAQVFFTLHTLTILMKVHSYAFYNGHLSETQRRLASLDKPGKVSMEAPIPYPDASPRRRSVVRRASHHARSESIAELREDLATELTSPLGNVTYPQNLTVVNYVDFIFCPTLCYELEYPRSKERRWIEIGLKTLAIFGCIFLLTLTSEEFILPVLTEANIQLHRVSSAADKALILAETISMLLFPFMVTFLLVFLVIFEYVLGAFAELTCFADRHFYSDWWNSCDWSVETYKASLMLATNLATGSSSPVNGTFPFTTSSAATYTSPRYRTSPNRSPCSSLSSSALLLTSWS